MGEISLMVNLFNHASPKRNQETSELRKGNKDLLCSF